MLGTCLNHGDYEKHFDLTCKMSPGGAVLTFENQYTTLLTLLKKVSDSRWFLPGNMEKFPGVRVLGYIPSFYTS